MGRGGELDCGESCMKYLLFFFNFLFFLIGGALLGIGLWLRFDEDMEHFFVVSGSDSGYAIVYFVIALGAFVFALGFLGCAGACCESKCMLGTYAAVVILMIILEIVAAILAGVYRNQIESGMLDEMQKQINDQYGEDASITSTWDSIQQNFKCCGAEGSGDWSSSTWANNNPGQMYPASCCEGSSAGCATPFENGCYNTIVDSINQNIGIIIGVSCGVVVFEIIAAIFACCVMKAI